MTELQALTDNVNSLRSTITQQLDESKREIKEKVDNLSETLQTTSNGIKNDVLAIRNHVINVLARENRVIRGRVQTLEERVLNLEKQVNRIEQNHRKSNFELDGIPASVTHDQLAPTIVKIVNTIVPETEKLTVKDVEACHRLPSRRKPAPTIVRMKRNHVDLIHTNRKKLKDVAGKVNLPNGTNIFVNHNLSPNMRVVDFNARKLVKEKVIAGAWFSNASVRIKCLNDQVLKINHKKDLFDAFPRYENFSFDTSFFESIEDRDMEKYDDLADMHDFDGELASYVNSNISLLEQNSNSSNGVVGTS